VEPGLDELIAHAAEMRKAYQTASAVARVATDASMEAFGRMEDAELSVRKEVQRRISEITPHVEGDRLV
jgi:hypothetical protein